MRLLLLAGLLLAACHRKHEATSGREFFKKYKAALLARDVDTVWAMSTKEVRERYISQATFHVRIQESREIDPPDRNPETLARTLMREWIDRNIALVESLEFVDASTGDLPMVGKTTTVTFKHKNADRDMMMLIEVDGDLKIWQSGGLLPMIFQEPPKSETPEE